MIRREKTRKVFKKVPVTISEPKPEKYKKKIQYTLMDLG